MRFLLAVIIFLVIIHRSSEAQGIPSDGREFYLGYVYPVFNDQPSKVPAEKANFSSVLLIATNTTTSVTIEEYDAQGKVVWDSTYIIQKRTKALVPLSPAMLKQHSIGEIPEYKSIHVTSTAPISVQYISNGYCSGGSYLGLPIQCLGKRYTVMSYHDNPVGEGGVLNNGAGASFAMVIANYDSTIIEITPTSTTLGGKIGICGAGSDQSPHPFTITLNKGQTYFFKSANTDGSCNLTGTTISSNYPIGVLAGHENAYVLGSATGNSVMEQRDFMIEQLLPVECFDTAGYYSFNLRTPRYGSLGGDGDNIGVVGDGKTITTVSITTDHFIDSLYISPYPQHPPYKVTLTSPAILHADKPFGVMLYDQRSHSIGVTNASPSMTSILPQSRWKSSYIISIPDTIKGQWQKSFYTIICDSADYYGEKIVIYPYTTNNSNYPLYSGGTEMLTKIAGTSLLAITKGVNPGTYYFTNTQYDEKISPRPFAMSVNTFAACDSNGKFPSFTTDVDYYSYANPAGMAYGEFGVPRPINFSYSLTWNCGKWDICLKDSGMQGNGIGYLEVVNYQPDFKLRASNKSLVQPSMNLAIEPSNDPLGTNEAVFGHLVASYCFSVARTHTTDTCRGTIAVYDNSGARLLVPLWDTASLLIGSRTAISPVEDSLVVGPITVGDTKYDTILFKVSNRMNQLDTAHVDLMIYGMHIQGDTSGLVIGALPIFPCKIKARAALPLPFAYKFSSDTTTSITVTFDLGCNTTITKTIIFKSGVGNIVASDVSFPQTLIDSVSCKEVSITNIGNAPVTITGYSIDSPEDYFIQTQQTLPLPLLLAPTDTAQLSLCFHPSSAGMKNARIDWQTDIPPGFESEKAYSLLSAVAVADSTVSIVNSTITTSFSVRSENGFLLLSSPVPGSFESIKMYDLTGHLVREWTTIELNSSVLRLPIAGLTRGTYILTVVTNGSSKDVVIQL